MSARHYAENLAQLALHEMRAASVRIESIDEQAALKVLADVFENARKGHFEDAARIVEKASRGNQEVAALVRAGGAQ